MDLIAKDKRIEYIQAGRVRIRPKEGGKAIPLVPSNVQRKVLWSIWEDVKAGRPIRQIDLKPRQVMMSSIIAAFFYAWARIDEGVSILVAAQKDATVEDLWTQKYQTFLRHDEDEPETVNDSAKCIKFKDTESKIDVRIGNPDLGRGGTRQGVHLTEFPYMKDPELIWGEVIPCVPNVAETAIFVESTGARPGDRYESMFRDSWEAQKRGKLLEFRALFFPWTEQEDYMIPLSAVEADALKGKLDQEERDLVREHGLTLEQIAWRRQKIEVYGGDRSMFINKYPLTPDEAFSARRESCFDAEAMLWIQKNMIRSPDFKCRISLDMRKDVHLVDSDTGELWIWQQAKRPSPYSRFTCYLDSAGDYGEETQDYHSQSAAAVVDNDSGEVVATWTGRSAPADFARIGFAIGKMWNMATMVVETNNHGHLTFHELRRLGYQRMWYNPSARSLVDEKQFGLTMNVNVRREIVDKMQDLVKWRRIGLHCERTFAQMQTFIRPLAGAQRARRGHRDDLVIAVAGAAWVASTGAEWSSREAQESRVSKDSASGPTKGRVWIPGMDEDMAMLMGYRKPSHDPNLVERLLTGKW